MIDGNRLKAGFFILPNLSRDSETALQFLALSIQSDR